ncbi:MAG: thioesterase family protein [Acidimicrobiia bacterium]
MSDLRALFEQRDSGAEQRHGGEGVFVATDWSGGPWDPNAAHGGAPAALLARAIEHHDPELPGFVARLTVELLRPVPLHVPLEVSSATVRPGRKVALVEASITSEGTPVATARALLIRRADLPVPDTAHTDDVLAMSPSEAAPVELRISDHEAPDGDSVWSGYGQANDSRVVAGTFETEGPGTAWFRLTVPVLVDEPLTPLMRVMAAADFPNGISRTLDWEKYLFINPDLTVALHRYPEGEWVALDAVSIFGNDGHGQSEAVLYDETGRIGRAVQSLFVDRY